MKKVANVKDKYNVITGYIFLTKDSYIYQPKGMSPIYCGDSIEDVERYVKQDHCLSFWDARIVYLKGFERKRKAMLKL